MHVSLRIILQEILPCVIIIIPELLWIKQVIYEAHVKALDIAQLHCRHRHDYCDRPCWCPRCPLSMPAH